jgi:hypothetical protein
MDRFSSESVSLQLKALSDTMDDVKSNLDLIDDKALVWQERFDEKLDLILRQLAPQHQENGAVQMAQITTLPGAVAPDWSEMSTICVEGEKTSNGEAAALTQGGPQGPDAVKRLASLPPSTKVFSKALKQNLQQKMLGKKGKTSFFSSDKKRKKADAFVLSSKMQQAVDTQTWLFRFTTTKKYEMGVLILIVLNSIFIGWQVQVVAFRVQESFDNGTPYELKPPQAFFAVNILFSLMFVVELSLRWIGEGFLEFLVSPDLLWNWFDIATVGGGVVELVVEASTSEAKVGSSISAIRVLRVLRVVRLLKLIRTYPFFHELRMMVESCLNSLKSYMWCVLVLILLTYLFAISMTTGACSYLSDGERRHNSADLESINLARFFGTLDKSMISLFQTIAGGRDWYEFYDVILLLDYHKQWLYLLYISFTMFAVCNVVAAVFVESAMQSSAHDRELQIREQLKDSQDYCLKMMAVFEEMDEDGTGTLSEDEFLSHLDDDRVQAYFNSMKLDVSDAASLFKLLDVDRSGSVEIMEFIEGCQKLKGESRTLDMHLMRYELHSIRLELHDLYEKFGKFSEVKGVAHWLDQRHQTTSLQGLRDSANGNGRMPANRASCAY